MNQRNSEMWESMREVDDARIHDFFAAEKKRLGDVLRGFTITWAPTEQEYHLEIYSEGSRTIVEGHPFPYGKGLLLGRMPQLVNGIDTLPQVQQAGRYFYYLWKKEICNLKRNLGK